MENTQIFDQLVEFAVSHGASRAKVLPSEQIVVDDSLAVYCESCPAVGLAASCPTYVSGPEGFRQVIETHKYAVVVRIEMPAAVLFGDERIPAAQGLHEIVSGLEHEAVRQGYAQAQAYAGGSCRFLYCIEEADCAVLSGGDCRHPDVARPSMSGFGIDVSRLMQSCGWDTKMVTRDTAPEEGSMSWLAGLVMLGNS